MYKRYELMLVLKSDFPADKADKLNELVSKLTHGATVKDVSVIGKKQLAYPIAKQKEGTYVVVQLEAMSLGSSEIEKEVRMGTDVLRFLLTVKGGSKES